MARERKAEAKRERAVVAGKRKETKRDNMRAVVHRPAVSIIGAGRLGSALALALAARGYAIEAVVAHRKQHARRVASSVGEDVIALDSTQLAHLPSSEITFITTPDNLIEETARQLAGLEKADWHGRIALHASGALSSDALESLRARGCATGSLHPLASVSDGRAGAERLRGSFFCIEGDARTLRIARRIVRDLDGRSFSIKASDKALYHAAAVMTSGHTVALFDLAAELFARCGLSEKLTRAALLPLLRGTVENLVAQTPARALTGTFARADTDTARRHLRALIEARKPNDALAAYVILGKRSLRLAAKNGANASALEEIARALKDAEMKD